MSSFFDSQLCKSQSKCHECRLSKSYRNGILLTFDKPTSANFRCPHGKTKKDFSGLPSPLTMAKNAAKAVGKVAKAAIDGEDKLVTKREAARRMDICSSCDERTIKGDTMMCQVCGCFLGLKTKLATEACPEGKWCSFTTC